LEGLIIVRRRTQTIRGGALRGDLEGVTPSGPHTQVTKKRIENPCNHWPRQIAIYFAIRLVVCPLIPDDKTNLTAI
jgi:hypothetical protein